MYGLPESPDTFTDALCELTSSKSLDKVIKYRMNMIKTASQKDKKSEDDKKKDV